MDGGLRILVVDDEELIRLCLTEWLTQDGHHVETAPDGVAALERIRSGSFDLVLTDMVMPRMDGQQLLQEAARCDVDLPVVVMTAHGSVESAVEAMKQGAVDYIQKPFDEQQLRTRIQHVRRHQRILAERDAFRSRLERCEGRCELSAQSPAMATVMGLMEDVAPTDATVLIAGESGTGKEVVGRALHARSKRAQGPFVAINFGALAENLAEAEIFGYQKGAFSGATATKKGLLELADGGTLFLDEIGEASPKIQVDLLRVLQERKFMRVGGTTTIGVDIRVVAATNRDLEAAIETGSFRRDLFYRLNVVEIRLPALRERVEDIPPLARRFIQEFAAEMKRPARQLAPETLAVLTSYRWPGNVRELRNAMERAVVFCRGETIFPECLPLALTREVTDERAETLADMEERHIRRVLAECSGNMSRAASQLGIDRSTLYAKVRKYGLRS